VARETPRQKQSNDNLKSHKNAEYTEDYAQKNIQQPPEEKIKIPSNKNVRYIGSENYGEQYIRPNDQKIQVTVEKQNSPIIRAVNKNRNLGKQQFSPNSDVMNIPQERSNDVVKDRLSNMFSILNDFEKKNLYQENTQQKKEK